MKSFQKILRPTTSLITRQKVWVSSSRLYTTTTMNNTTSTNQVSMESKEAPHDELHALYNNENQSVLDHLDHPSYHEKQSGNPDAFAPNFNSVFDE
ncbi:unnamed protein product [Cunninghamella echinulata]